MELRLIDQALAKPMVEELIDEIQDSTYQTLEAVSYFHDMKEGFKDCDVAILVNENQAGPWKITPEMIK